MFVVVVVVVVVLRRLPGGSRVGRGGVADCFAVIYYTFASAVARI